MNRQTILDYPAVVDLLTAIFKQARSEARRGDTEATEFLIDMGATMGAKEKKKMGKLTQARAALATEQAKEQQFIAAIAAANRMISTCDAVLDSATATPDEKVRAQADADSASRGAGEMNRQLQQQKRLTAVTAERVRDLEFQQQQLQAAQEANEAAIKRIPEGAYATVTSAANSLRPLLDAMTGTPEALRLRDIVIALGSVAGSLNQPHAALQRTRTLLAEME